MTVSEVESLDSDCDSAARNKRHTSRTCRVNDARTATCERDLVWCCSTACAGKNSDTGTGDIGIAVLSGACGGAVADQVALAGGGAGIVNSAGTRSVTFVSCGTVSAGIKTFNFGSSHVINPTTAQSYKIRIAGTAADQGVTMVAIVNQVTVTASVDTSFTFTVAGVASGQAVNSTTTSTTTTAVAIGFGTLSPGVIVTGAQDLTVTTNAQNGFIVTVHEDQNLLSSNGADIDLFKDGAATAAPVVWTAPVNTLGNESTYGHLGVTSDDSDLNSGEFTSAGGNKWAGNFYATATRAIFSNTGPADGTTQNVGKARVGYRCRYLPSRKQRPTIPTV